MRRGSVLQFSINIYSGSLAASTARPRTKDLEGFNDLCGNMTAYLVCAGQGQPQRRYAEVQGRISSSGDDCNSMMNNLDRLNSLHRGGDGRVCYHGRTPSQI